MMDLLLKLFIMNWMAVIVIGGLVLYHNFS